MTSPTPEAAPTVVTLGTSGMSRDEVVAIARGDARVVLAPPALAAMAAAREHVERLAGAAEPVYGVSTGFGALAQRHIPVDDRVQLQRSLVRSHAAGYGDLVEREVVRAMMALRLKTLASGRTGARPVVAETMAALLNAGITPAVHEYGSLGCSGDLAPLAACALVLMGEGHVLGDDGVPVEAAPVLAAHGIAPVELREKEGLALINGTDGMLGMLVMALADLEQLADAADVAAAMSVEGLLGTDAVFIPELHEPLRPHPGQARSAARMLALLEGSAIIASHLQDDDRVQDAYSLRCAPQVTGGLRDTMAHAAAVADRELAAAIDNPVILDSGAVSSNGNFHGAPVAYVLDFLAIPATDVASMSERRTDRMLDAKRSHGLAPFLADDPGVDSGLMIAQYTQAGLVSDCKRLAAPASVDSIPSSAMQEDHVSMGWHAARKLRRIVDNLAAVLGIELMTAARAIELRAPLAPAARTGAVVAALRAGVPGVRPPVPGAGPDRHLAPEIAAAAAFARVAGSLA